MSNIAGSEWTALDRTQQSLLMDDLLADDELTISEYLRRIGKGNLAAYVRCLETRND